MVNNIEIRIPLSYLAPWAILQGIVVFASVMATLGLQILFESGRQLLAKVSFNKFNLQFIQWFWAALVSLYDAFGFKF